MKSFFKVFLGFIFGVVATLGMVVLIDKSENEGWTVDKLRAIEAELIEQIEIKINSTEGQIQIDSIRFIELGPKKFSATLYGTESHTFVDYGVYQDFRKRKTKVKPFTSKFLMEVNDEGRITWDYYSIVKNIEGW
jgi:hypothetical protein